MTGLPKDLEEGYRAYRDWAEAMFRAGEPLPPGGCFVLNRWTVIKTALLRLQKTIAAELKMPPSHVRIEVEQAIGGGFEPRVLVNPPDGWLEAEYMKGVAVDGKRAEEFAESYIQATIRQHYAEFREDIEARLAILAVDRRPELQPKDIEDLVEGAEGTPEDRG